MRTGSTMGMGSTVDMGSTVGMRSTMGMGSTLSANEPSDHFHKKLPSFPMSSTEVKIFATLYREWSCFHFPTSGIGEKVDQPFSASFRRVHQSRQTVLILQVDVA